MDEMKRDELIEHARAAIRLAEEIRAHHETRRHEVAVERSRLVEERIQREHQAALREQVV